MPTNSQHHIVLSCVVVPVRCVTPTCKINFKVGNNERATSFYTLSLFYCHEFQQSSCSLTKPATVLQPSFPPTRTEWCFCITLKFMIHLCVSNWRRVSQVMSMWEETLLQSLKIPQSSAVVKPSGGSVSSQWTSPRFIRIANSGESHRKWMTCHILSWRLGALCSVCLSRRKTWFNDSSRCV